MKAKIEIDTSGGAFALIPVFVDPIVADACDGLMSACIYRSTILLKRKYGKYPEIRISKINFYNPGLRNLIPRVKNSGKFKNFGWRWTRKKFIPIEMVLRNL